MKIKVQSKKSTWDIIYDKIVSFRKFLIPAIIILIPTIFILYVLNVHNYLFPSIMNGNIYFRLDYFYKYTFIILAFMYIYQVIYEGYELDISDYGMFIFIAFTIFSTFTAYNLKIALNGFPYRYEGMFTLLFYSFLYLNCKLLKDRTTIKWYISLIISCVFLQFVTAILQDTGLFQKVIYLFKTGDIVGLTENCNFLGSLVCMLSIISLGFFLFNKKKYYLIPFFVSYILLLMANSTGPFISFVFTLILVIIFAIVRKIKIWKRLIICLIPMLVLYPFVLHGNDRITPEIKSTVHYFLNYFDYQKEDELSKDNGEETSSTSSSVIDTSNKLGNGRIRIWRNVFKSVKKRFWLGYGPDNLGLVYEKSADDSAMADKAHNVYLHILVSSGIFALLGYLLWLVFIIIKGIKSRDLVVNILCFGVIAYSVQATFNINVSEVTPYFYLVSGFMMALLSIPNNNKIS